MGMDINRLPNSGLISNNNPVNNYLPDGVKFYRKKLPADSFESTLPAKYTSEFMIKKLAGENPRIPQILSSAGIPCRVNTQNLNSLIEGHCKDTQRIAEGIVNNLPSALGCTVDLPALKDAAYLHDIGKVFIPEEILNKKGKLSKDEFDIIHLHPELGYELLRNTNLGTRTLDLIRNHHMNQRGKNFHADINLQILSIADKYSALLEKRAYKPAFTREQALTIIYSDVRQGKFNPYVFDALVNYTSDSCIKPSSVTPAKI